MAEALTGQKRTPVPFDGVVDVDWLVRLRWLAFLALGILVLLGPQLAPLALPLVPLLTISLALAGSNAVLALYAHRRRLTATGIGSVLILDILLLTAALYWTGGPSNPFSVLFLVHVALAAVVLGAGWTWALALLATACFTLLFRFHVQAPLLGHHNHSMDGNGGFSLHLQGMLFAFAIAAFLIAFFVTRVRARMIEQELKLRSLEAARLNEERLASLATLSAGAAHELGSPLATIAVCSAELSALATELGSESSDLQEY
ncbi:MAG: hypothetical protein KDD69_19810, partial [Bdellovibrionales bacterium]|nr:hypothetical protein [Bdellovibrionales bacterium]